MLSLSEWYFLTDLEKWNEYIESNNKHLSEIIQFKKKYDELLEWKNTIEKERRSLLEERKYLSKENKLLKSGIKL